MTQTRFGLESLPAKDDSTVSPPLHNQQSVSSSKHKPGTGFSSGSVKAGARSGAQRGNFVPATRRNRCICGRPNKCGTVGDKIIHWKGKSFPLPPADANGIVTVASQRFKVIADDVGLCGNCVVLVPYAGKRHGRKQAVSATPKTKPSEVVAEIKRYLVLADLALGVPDYLETPLSFQERKAIRDLIQRADQRGQDLLPILWQFAASMPAVKELMPLVERAVKDVSWQLAGVLEACKTELADPELLNNLVGINPPCQN
jgi:hypothetical protein